MIPFEQFEEYFSGKEGTIFGCPHLKMTCNALKLTNDYVSVKEAHDTKNKYQSLLIDIHNGKTFPNIQVGGEYQWFKKSLTSLEPNGTLYGRIPTYLIAKLCDRFKDLYVKQIKILGDYCLVDIINKQSAAKTVVKYPEKIIEIDIHNQVILDHYNEEFYTYLNSVDLSKSCERTTIDGKGAVLEEQLKKRSNRTDFEKVIFLSSATPNIKWNTFEEVKDKNVGGDAFFAKSVEERDKYIEVFSNQKVHKLMMSMCFKKYVRMKLDHKKYILNEKIFDFAQ